MTTPATQFKIGLFVICTIGAAIAIAVGLGLHARKPVVRYHTYVDEPVTGLEVGSTVVFRGVRVGTVGAIAVAPDHSRIDIALNITTAAAAELGLEQRAAKLRARLETSGITGIKYVDLEPGGGEGPPPKLDFTPDAHYIPALPSLFASLKSRADTIGRQVPVLVDHATAAVDKLNLVLDDIHSEHLPTRIRQTIDHTDAAVSEVRRFVGTVDRSRLPDKAGAVLAHVDAAVAKAREALAAVEGRGALEQTIQDIGDAARAFHELVQDVEREPDILVKGHARSNRP